MNYLCIVGRLVKDTELKTKENGTKYCNFIIAVNRHYKNEEGCYDTDFIECECYNQIAENITNYCRKGDIIGVNGCLHTETIKLNDISYKKMYVKCEKLSFISSGDKESVYDYEE